MAAAMIQHPRPPRRAGLESVSLMLTRFMPAISVTRFSLAAVLSALVLGVPVAAHAEAQVGEKFGDWMFECQAIADGKTDCALTQTLMNKQTNQAVIKLILARAKGNGDLAFKVLVPLGIDLQAGITGNIDDKAPVKFVLETCVQAGCLASAKPKGGVLDAIKGAAALNLSFSGKGNGNKVSAVGSLKGLMDGIVAAGYGR